MKCIGSLHESERSFKWSVEAVVAVTADGRSHENPGFKKTNNCAIDYFEPQYFNALFIASNSSRRSAFDRSEKKNDSNKYRTEGCYLKNPSIWKDLDDQDNNNDNNKALYLTVGYISTYELIKTD